MIFKNYKLFLILYTNRCLNKIKPKQHEIVGHQLYTVMKVCMVTEQLW